MGIHEKFLSLLIQCDSFYSFAHYYAGQINMKIHIRWQYKPLDEHNGKGPVVEPYDKFLKNLCSQKCFFSCKIPPLF